MKKTAGILSLVLLLSLSACTVDNVPSDNSKSSAESQTAVSSESVSEVSQEENSQQEGIVPVEWQDNSTVDNVPSDNSKSSAESQTAVSSESVSEVSQEENNQQEGIVPVDWQDNGIFSEYYEKAYQKMSDMSLDEKIGQMLYARCPDQDAVAIAQQYHLGGYVLFGRDFEDRSKEEVIEAIDSYIHSQEIPMTISVDEEGGTVVRISSKPALYDREFDSPRDIFAQGGMTAIQENALAMAQMLESFHIDVNFAPVCDISVDEDDFMYYRSIGQDVDTTCQFVSEFTKIAQENGVSATLKHFPGYGNNVDTHTGIAIDERDYETFQNADFKPFKAGIDTGAHLVMVSHNIVNCMDSTQPASLSPKVHEILRDELGFTGIAVTDDLEMDAITEYTGGNSPAVSAILAGNDMLTIGDSMIEDTIVSVKNAVSDGTVDEDLINRAVMRILAWKYAKNMM